MKDELKLRNSVIVQKKWGTEEIISREPYGCKIMTLYPKSRVSNHFHISKHEAFILIEGKLTLEITDLRNGLKRTVYLTRPYNFVTLKPYEAHTFYCPEGQTENTIFIESSSEDTDLDNYRFTQSTGPEDTNTR